MSAEYNFFFLILTVLLKDRHGLEANTISLAFWKINCFGFVSFITISYSF